MPLETMTTVEKAVDVLFHLNSSTQPLGVSAIGRALGMPKSSTHRLLSALARRGLVERQPGGLYQPGIGLVALGFGVLDRDALVVASLPVLEAFADRVGETFFLVGAKARRLLVLAKAEGTGFLRAAPRVGSRVPVHATAAGKLYLAFAPAEVVDEPRVAFTPRTLRTPDALRAEAELARTRGWAANRDEWVAGMSVLAAPVMVAGRMLGAVALAAASPRLEQLGGDEQSTNVLDAASQIGARLEGAAQ